VAKCVHVRGMRLMVEVIGAVGEVGGGGGVVWRGLLSVGWAAMAG
jgi:hypothetical protein